MDLSFAYSALVSLKSINIWSFSTSVITSISLICFAGAFVISCKICPKCAAILRTVSSLKSSLQYSQFTMYPSGVISTVTVKSNLAILDPVSTSSKATPCVDTSSSSLFCSTNITSKIGFLDISLFTFTLSTTSSKGYS
ncbi:hypothetical protein D3C73_662550 [compost metagenome]